MESLLEPFFDEIKNVNSWDNFKWKVVEPYIKAINNQPRTAQNFILLGIFIVAPISFSYLHGLGSWLFNLTLMNFNLHFIGCVFLIIVLGGCIMLIPVFVWSSRHLNIHKR